ncbi:MAG: FprA family A-type flavoprotein [Clostridium sp.]|nr:FprA family A-type flavoprotein [Clostridium sp.]
MKQLANGVFYAGVLNPNMRVFDVIMRTEYGTSYNSYIVRGSEKTAIIDAAHKSFTALYEDGLEEVLGGAAPDYLIINHTEPDHSGCVADLLARYPRMELYCTRAAGVCLKNITNLADLRVHIISDGETLQLGGKTLSFHPAPFLHWPDTMFTYLKEERLLFSCDFLGAHYCEPGITDKHLVYTSAYKSALKNYFDCIFGPFKPWVRKGLDIAATLEIDAVCPSHGPVLTKGVLLENAFERYAEWCAPPKRERPLIPIFYCTAYGNTAALAAAVRRGILSARPDAECECYNLIEQDEEEMTALLNGSDAFAIGCLTINRDAVPPVYRLLAHADAVNMPKRPAALFASFGWSGEGFANTAARLSSLKCSLFEKQLKVTLVPTEDDLKAAEAFGAEFYNTFFPG